MDVKSTDVVIIGAGGAGLRAAIISPMRSDAERLPITAPSSGCCATTFSPFLPFGEKGFHT